MEQWVAYYECLDDDHERVIFCPPTDLASAANAFLSIVSDHLQHLPPNESDDVERTMAQEVISDEFFGDAPRELSDGAQPIELILNGRKYILQQEKWPPS